MSRAVKEAIVLAAEYYGRQLSPSVLAMYAEDLADLPPDAVCEAYRQWRRNPQNKTFPLPAQIRELASPEQFISAEAQAREIASRIVGAITKFGWCNSKEAQVFIGPVGWELVRRYGGWSHLCQNVGVTINPTTLLAQLRDQLESTLHYGQAAMEESIGVTGRSHCESPELVNAADAVRVLVSNLEAKKGEP